MTASREAAMQVVRAGGAQFDIEQSGSGPDLLLLHSLLTDPGSFSAIVPALSRTRRVTLVSLPGFGRSTPAGPSIADSADRLAQLVSTLDEKPDVLGNGYGGGGPGGPRARPPRPPGESPPPPPP